MRFFQNSDNKLKGIELPGVSIDDNMLTKEQEAAVLLRREGYKVIGEKDIIEAVNTLNTYKQGKANLEARLIEDEQWYKLRHWEVLNRGKDRSNNGASPAPTSAWLFNAIINKHADAMDNYPEPVVLPREESDKNSAEILSEVLPVIYDNNNYRGVYSNNWWEKLKHGTGVYGVFWNSKKENGLGDIDIKDLDLTQIFWEPGIKDIQNSRNLFICELVDTDLLEKTYSQCAGKIQGDSIKIEEYIYDDNVDTSDKSVVVDWYYKKAGTNGRTLLHFVKFVGNVLIYASENDPDYRDSGWYEHGLYPVVFDTLFPEKGTPVGFGYVSVCKDPQLYIDKLSANILESSLMNTKKRFFIEDGTDINEEELLDWNKPLVHVTGKLTEDRLREIVCRPLDGIYLSVMQQKIEEMKETSANRDFSNGSVSGGVTAASAIAALQESGNKTSRDMIDASYSAHVMISKMCIELIRQFYSEQRSFRIMAPNGTEYQFVNLDNSQIADQQTGIDSEGVPLYRHPVFDLKVKAQKKNPFSRMEQNEIALNLYKLGFFNADRAQESLIALQMMDFEGIEEVRKNVQEGQTLLNMVQQLTAQMQQMTAVLSALTGEGPAITRGQEEPQTQMQGGISEPDINLSSAPNSGYINNLANRTMQ